MYSGHGSPNNYSISVPTMLFITMILMCVAAFGSHGWSDADPTYALHNNSSSTGGKQYVVNLRLVISKTTVEVS